MIAAERERAHRLAVAAGKPQSRKVARLAYSKAEAADALGVSVDTIERYVWPDVRLIRIGRLVLVPLTELERWIERNAARTLE
jgi:excisionase family DNA binding protein